MTPLPILYSFRRCPYAMRARHALLAGRQTVVLREVLLRDKPADMLAVSPKGTVPVLVLPDGTVLEESLDIMAWALDRADPDGWCSEEPADGSDADLLIARNDGPFKHHLDRYKYANRYEGADATRHRDAAEAVLADLDARLQTRPFLLGDRFTRADAALLPFVRQFANADRSWFDATPYPSVQRWLASYLASPGFAAVMFRVPQWQPGQDEVLFPPR